MFKFLVTIFLLGVIAGVYFFASPSAKDKAAKATSELVGNAADVGSTLVKDAAGNAADAAADKIEEGSHKLVSRVKDIRAQNDAKFAKKK
jgi:hypothetical protein